MHTVMATLFSCWVNIFVCTPMKSCTAVAWLGLLGSLVSLSPVRKLLQPNAPSTKHRETAATLIERVMVDLRYRFKVMVNTKDRVCGLPKYSDP